MNKLFIFEIIKSIKGAPDFKRKLKFFLGVGLIGTVVTVTLVIWISIAGMRYATNLVQGQAIVPNIDSLKSELSQLPVIAKVDCWDKAQSLLSVNAWLERPIAENFRNLKLACLETQVQKCIGRDCNTNESK